MTLFDMWRDSQRSTAEPSATTRDGEGEEEAMSSNELRIYGASDDLVEVEGVEDGEIGAWEVEVVFLIGEGNTALGVAVKHDDQRGWLIGTFMPRSVKDESKWAPPEARLTTAGMERRTPYSPMLSVDVPEGAKVVAFRGGEKVPIQ